MHRSMVCAVLPRLFGVFAFVGSLFAQQFQATATGMLTAWNGVTTQSYGPGPIGSTLVTASNYGVSGIASATAALLPTGLDISMLATVAGQGAVDVTLLLDAPVGAGVRVRVVGVAGTSWLGSFAATALGLVHQPGAGGIIEFEAVTPAGGLAVQIVGSCMAAPFTAATLDLDATWSYPGVSSVGAPTPGCRGPAVTWTLGVPHLGNAAFGFTGANADPTLGGLCVLGTAVSPVPLAVLGFDLFVDPGVVEITYVPGSGSGDLLRPLPLPATPTLAGFALAAQWVLIEALACAPTGFSAANAVRVVLQP